jgi:hypothetical protein
MNSKTVPETVTSIYISSNTSISSTSLSISGKACYLHPRRGDIDDVYDTYDARLLLDDICHNNYDNNYDKKEDEWIDIIHYNNSQHEEGEEEEGEEEEKEERKRDKEKGEHGDEGMKEGEKEEAWDMRYGDIQRIEEEEKEREIKLR